MFDGNSRETIIGQGITNKREIASLTKIFTLYTACSIIEKYRINPDTFKVEISYCAEAKVGTTADLESGDLISLKDLLYGLMLPSGNDAAVAICISLGGFLLEHKPGSNTDIDGKVQSAKSSMNLNARRSFLKEMNSICIELGLKNTSFKNSHGLTNTFNTSTVKEIASTFALALNKYPLFKSIVTTRYISNNNAGSTHRRSQEETIETINLYGTTLTN